MPTSITCERCGRRLLISWAPNYELTCPHCMAKLRNPNYGQAPSAPERPTAQAIRREAPAEQAPARPASPERPPENRCLSCDALLEPGWRCCPYCRSPRRGFREAGPAYSLDTDVRRDSTGTVVGLCFLGVLVVIGILTFTRVQGAELLRGTSQGTIIVVSFVVLAAGLACLLVAGRSTTVKTVLSTLAMVALAGLLVVFTVCAGILNFFEACKCQPTPGKPPSRVSAMPAEDSHWPP
jgi:hypothetical protein